MTKVNPDPRKARLSAALRENLKKRKDQARLRAAAGAQDSNAAEPESSTENGPPNGNGAGAGAPKVP